MTAVPPPESQPIDPDLEPSWAVSLRNWPWKWRHQSSHCSLGWERCNRARLWPVQTHGLTKDGEKLTQEGTIAGTPAYMSPEQADGKENLDARSDIYSPGAVAYFLLTGQPPFARATAMQTLAANMLEPVVALNYIRSDIPADLQEIVLRCLAKEPSERFASAEYLERACAILV